MHKSKNYDMATQVAMDKLMPKPIHIAISMQGGGSLSSIELPVIKRVSGGDIGDDNSFIGGYTDADAGVYDVGVQDDPTLISTPDDPEDLATSKPGSSIRHGTRGWTKEGAGRGVRDLIDNYGENVVLPIARLLGLPLKAEYSNKQADMIRTEPGRDEKTLTDLDLESDEQPYRPGHGGKQERIDLIRELGLYPGQANKMQDASRERSEALRESERQRNIPERYRHSFRNTKSLFGKPKALPLSRQPRSIRNLPVGFATGGGLSSINKPISINGKRHNLAWINSDEASVLKAMGGSGKPGPMGIPSYEDDDSTYEDASSGFSADTAAGVEDYGISAADMAAVYTDIGIDTYDPPTYGTGTDHGGTEDERDTGEVAHYYPSTPQPTDQRDDDGEERQALLDRPELNIYKNQLIERLGGKGMEDYLKGLGTSDLKTMIDKWHTGYDFGGPMGTMEGLSREIGKGYEKKLKFKDLAKELKELKERNLSDEDFEMKKGEILSRYQGFAKDIDGEFIPSHEFQGLYGDKWEKTLKSHGFEDPDTGDLSLIGKGIDFVKPFSMISKVGAMGLNALTNLFGVIGEFTTPDGKSFRVMDDGTLVEPDMPPDPSSVDTGTVEVDETVGSVVAPRPIEVAEKKKVGLSDVFDQESKRPASNVHLSALLDAIYGEGQGQEMLG